jgi:hypothetical protein
LQYTGAIILFAAVVFTIGGLYTILVRYDCRYLWYQVLLPFFATLLLETALLATPMRFITYIAKNTWGYPVTTTYIQQPSPQQQETANLLKPDTSTTKKTENTSDKDEDLERGKT